MRPITLRLFNQMSDAYFYMGKLFILTDEGQLKYIDNQRFFNLYLADTDESVNYYLQRILFGNDDLPSLRNFNDKNDKFSNEFTNFWTKILNRKFEFQIAENHLQTVCHLPQNDPLDFVIYAQRAYLANRDGLYECKLNFENADVTSDQGFKRVFDSKTININPRAGKLLLSTKSDGLFAGSINSFSENVKIPERSITESSVRTGWANYNFVNYSSTVDGDFFTNATEVEKSNIGINFMVEDGGTQNKKITEIGTSKQDLTNMFVRKSNNENIIFTFNSLTITFSISDSGTVYYAKFQDESSQASPTSIPLNAFRGIKFDIVNLGNPLAAFTVGAGGTVYEFFDRVLLLKNGTIELVSEIECNQIRTFASSKWFKNIILTLSDEYLEVHSVHPYL